MAKSLNRVQLIGNLTRDPELRYTPNGKAVCSFSIATNRSWTSETGERREEVDFHRIVAWGKLAEICSQYLAKGRKTYVEGRLSTRSWTGQDGSQKSTTEVVIDDMILLDNRGGPSQQAERSSESVDQRHDEPETQTKKPVKKADAQRDEESEAEHETAQSNRKASKPNRDEEVAPDDIPF